MGYRHPAVGLALLARHAPRGRVRCWMPDAGRDCWATGWASLLRSGRGAGPVRGDAGAGAAKGS